MMHSPNLSRFAVTGLGLAFAVAVCGCAPAATDGGSGGASPGSGGSQGSGGTTSSSGGATSSSGGATGSGGTTSASGGATGSGGRGSGGASSGGATGSGGASSGGSPGSGGATATGGNGGGPTGGGNGGGGRSGSGGAAAGGSSGGAFTLTSKDHVDGAKFGMMFTCAAMNGAFGSGVIPELVWSGVPANTKSFAMTFIDTKLGENSAMGQHWAMWDVKATVTKVPQGTITLTGDLMGAKQTNKYLSPCPSGDDTYAFTLYALSTETLTVTAAEGTGVANSAGVAKVLAALRMVTPLGTAKLTGTSGPMGR